MERDWKLGNVVDWNKSIREMVEEGAKHGYTNFSAGIWYFEINKPRTNTSIMIDKVTGELIGVTRD